MIGDTVIGYITHYLTMEIAPELASGRISFEGSLYEYLESTHNKKLLEGEETIGIKISSFAESKVLNIEVGKALFVLKRRAYTDNGILEYCESLFNPDHFEMEVTMKGSD